MCWCARPPNLPLVKLHRALGQSQPQARRAPIRCALRALTILRATFAPPTVDFTGALRSHSPSHSLAMAALAAESHKLGAGCVGFDLAGDEGSFPLALHREAVEWCKREGVPVTVHAGECECSSAQSGCARSTWQQLRDGRRCCRRLPREVVVDVARALW